MAKKKYTDEFKMEAVRLAREARRSGKSSDVVARDLGMHPNTLKEWVRLDDSVHAGLARTLRDCHLARSSSSCGKKIAS